MKTIYYRLLFFISIALFIFENHIQAQIKLTGEIVDRGSAPLPGVLVNFSNGFIRSTSDTDGKFSLTYPDSLKNAAICFQVFGYKTKTMTVNNRQESIKVILIDSLYNLQTITVSAPKYGRFSDYSAQTIQMSTFDIVTNPAAMGDMLGGMRVLPGIQINDNDGRLIVQGGSPDESQIYINDLIVANPYTATSKNTNVRSRFSSDLFEGIALQSGGFNAEFGQALSGILNLNTKEKALLEPKTDIAVSSVYAGVTHIDQKPSYAYRASINYTDLGLYNQIVPSEYDWSNPYRQIEGDFFITKEFSKKTKMTAQMNFSRSGGEYSYENIDSIRFDSNIRETYLYAQANVYHSFNPKWTLSLASNLVIDQFSGTEVRYKNDKLDDRNIWNHNKINLQYASGKLTNRMGMEYICNPFNETYSLDQNYKTDIRNNLISLYNDCKFFLTNNLSVSLSLRGEYSIYLKKFNLAPRIYAGYRLNREHIVSASIGNYYQLPSMNYLKLDHSIGFTSVTKGTISYSYVKKNSKFQLDTYYKKYKDAITYYGTTFYPANMQNNGKGYGMGGCVFWKSNLKELEYWLTYSYNHTEKLYAYFPTEIAPPYTAQHSLNLTLKYWVAPLKSLLGAGYNVSSGMAYYRDSYPYDQLGTAPFHNRLDASWSFLPRPGVIIHFGCQNILGYKNIYGYQYSNINPDARQAITSPSKRFFFVGVFLTFSQNKKLNQLKNL